MIKTVNIQVKKVFKMKKYTENTNNNTRNKQKNVSKSVNFQPKMQKKNDKYLIY
jgi:hypothetical protein